MLVGLYFEWVFLLLLLCGFCCCCFVLWNEVVKNVLKFLSPRMDKMETAWVRCLPTAYLLTAGDTLCGRDGVHC